MCHYHVVKVKVVNITTVGSDVHHTVFIVQDPGIQLQRTPPPPIPTTTSFGSPDGSDAAKQNIALYCSYCCFIVASGRFECFEERSYLFCCYFPCRNSPCWRSCEHCNNILSPLWLPLPAINMSVVATWHVR